MWFETLETRCETQAAKTAYGRPLVNSMFTLSLLVGISVHETTHGTTVANLGFENVTFPAPVFHGDTLRATTTVVAARREKRRVSSRDIVLTRPFSARAQRTKKLARARALSRKGKVFFSWTLFLIGSPAIERNAGSASRPTQGVVTFEHRAFNQHGVLVAKCTRSALMNCRPKAYGGIA